jgi:hypothetical protein
MRFFFFLKSKDLRSPVCSGFAWAQLGLHTRTSAGPGDRTSAGLGDRASAGPGDRTSAGPGDPHFRWSRRPPFCWSRRPHFCGWQKRRASAIGGTRTSYMPMSRSRHKSEAALLGQHTTQNFLDNTLSRKLDKTLFDVLICLSHFFFPRSRFKATGSMRCVFVQNKRHVPTSFSGYLPDARGFQLPAS